MIYGVIMGTVAFLDISPTSSAASAVDATVHAVATTVNDLAVQVLQLLQPLYLLIMILQGLSIKFIIFAAILT
jgi:hypothetical protein